MGWETTLPLTLLKLLSSSVWDVALFFFSGHKDYFLAEGDFYRYNQEGELDHVSPSYGSSPGEIHFYIWDLFQ